MNPIMRKVMSWFLVALGSAMFALTLDRAARASLPRSATACSSSDIGPTTGVTFVDCSGFFAGNLLNRANFPEVKAMIATGPNAADAWDGFGFIFVLGTWTDIEKVDAATSPVTFKKPLVRDFVMGLHWGGGQPDRGGNTAFYHLRVDASYDGSGLNVGNNPVNGTGRLSGAALLWTDESFPPVAAAVSEPGIHAMLFAGLGLLGFVARRRLLKDS